MVFKCQEDSFLKQFSTKVVSCESVEYTLTIGKTPTKISGYAVVLQDTILFPEGGGQPSDFGLINGQKVEQIVRKSDTALHYVEAPLQVDQNVLVEVDWPRRFDHMQQHSGQHLISALFEREFKYKTVSWYLGEEISYIELATSTIAQSDIDKIQNIANEAVRDGTQVSVEILKKDTPPEQLEKFRSVVGLPADHQGDIRVITIDGIDSNMCCGTHVANLSQLQIVKLLHWEKSKRKGQILLYFQIGNRMLDRFKNMVEREQKLNSLLKTNPNQHVEFVEKLSQNLKTTNKNLQNVLKEVIIYETEKLKNSPVKYYCLHKKEAEPDFMSTFIRELNRTDIFLFLSTGDEKGNGNIMLFGDEKFITEFDQKICEILNGKGNGKGNRFQAKCTNMANRTKVEELIRQYFDNK